MELTPDCQGIVTVALAQGGCGFADLRSGGEVARATIGGRKIV